VSVLDGKLEAERACSPELDCIRRAPRPFIDSDARPGSTLSMLDFYQTSTCPNECEAKPLANPSQPCVTVCRNHDLGLFEVASASRLAHTELGRLGDAAYNSAQHRTNHVTPQRRRCGRLDPHSYTERFDWAAKGCCGICPCCRQTVRYRIQMSSSAS